MITPPSWPNCLMPNSVRNPWRIGKRFSIKARIPFGVIQTPEEAAEDPQLRANDIVVPIEGAETWSTRSTTRSPCAGWRGYRRVVHRSTESTTPKSSNSWDSAPMTSTNYKLRERFPLRQNRRKCNDRN